MVKEVWFWTALVGIVFAGFVGFDWRFATKSGKLKKRKNYNTDRPISVIAFTEFGIVVAETIFRMATGRPSVVLDTFTDEIFYEIVLFSLMFIVIYGTILVLTIGIVDVAHIGLHQIRLEQDKAEEQEALQDLVEWLEDYDRQVEQASIDSEYETAM